MSRNIVLADCDEEEIISFVEGVESVLSIKLDAYCKNCNFKRTPINELKRYLVYFALPFKYAVHSKDYDLIIAWQQFFAIFYSFYCRVFHKKKSTVVIAANFTYKEKSGFLGKIYKKLIKFCVNSDYIDYYHIPSRSAVDYYYDVLGIPNEKFIITRFGIDDEYERWRNHPSKLKDKQYTLAIGRSNRDYDFLIKAWEHMPEDKVLAIISDTYYPQHEIPNNVRLKHKVFGYGQYPWIVNCSNMVIPIADGNICSGDTVLLKAMSFERPVVVTVPSTLSEMYITNGVDGLCIEKDAETFAKEILRLYEDEAYAKSLGKNAREKFLASYSRESMARDFASQIKYKTKK